MDASAKADEGTSSWASFAQNCVQFRLPDRSHVERRAGVAGAVMKPSEVESERAAECEILQGIQCGVCAGRSVLPLRFPELSLEFCSANDPRYVAIRKDHYLPYQYTGADGKIHTKGSHGQQVHFLIWYQNQIAGIISGGGAVYATTLRDRFFGITKTNRPKVLNGIIDNTIFRLTNHEYNLGTRVLALWERAVSVAWKEIYGVQVFGFETFIVRQGLMKEIVRRENGKTIHRIELAPDEKVRPGTMYKAANWTHVGRTVGSTEWHNGVGLPDARRGGKGDFLQKTTPPKDVYCKWANGCSSPVESEYRSSWKAGTAAGTEEEKALAKLKSATRKALLGQRFYLRGGKLVRENF